MHVIVPKNLLAANLARAASVADRKSSNEAAHRVYIETVAGGLELRGTDIFRSLVCSAVGPGVEILIPGSVALGAKDLLDRVKFMPDGPVELRMDDQCGVDVRAVGAPRRYRLSGIPGSEFPKVPSRGKAEPALRLPGTVLADLIGRTKSVVSTDETRPHVNSALFELFEERIRLVATDGHRATYAERVVPSLGQSPSFGQGLGASLLVPLRGLGDVADLSADAGEAEVAVSLVGSDVFFEVAGVTLSIRFTDAVFPPYRMVFASTSTHAMRIGRLPLIDRVKAIALASNGKTGGIRLRAKPDRLVVEASDPDSGAGYDEVMASYTGSDLTVGVAAAYLEDALRGMEPAKDSPGAAADEVLLSITGELDPIRIDPGTPDPGMTVVSVVMPMRI